MYGSLWGRHSCISCYDTPTGAPMVGSTTVEEKAMSNFDLVFVYAPDHAEEFRERGLPHPEVRPDNEMPTTNDLLWAVGTFKNLSYDRLPRSEDGELTIHDEKTDCWF